MRRPDSPPVEGAAPGSTALVELAAELVAEDSVISPHVTELDRGGEARLVRPVFGPLIAAGPRTAARAELYAMVIESVREGYLLHYGASRLLAGADPDLALLAGDYLYAKGLALLARVGDLEAIDELADLISLSARLHSDGGADVGEPGPAALWLASTVAIAAGAGEDHEAAKGELGLSGSVQRLFACASKSARGAGLEEQLADAADAVGFRPPALG